MNGSMARKARSLLHADSGSQGPDRPPAGAARRLPLFQRAGRDSVRRQGPGAARPGAQLPRRPRHQPAHRRAAGRGPAPRGDRHRLGGRGARAREPPHQAARAEVQHPAARRQELPLPAADDRRSLSAGARGPPRRERRPLLRRAVPAGVARPADDVADAPAVRDPVVQRGDHRRAGAAVPRVRHQALHRAVRARDLQRRRVRVAVEHTRLFLEGPQRRAGRRR